MTTVGAICTSSKSYLLDLPAELRLCIYSHLDKYETPKPSVSFHISSDLVCCYPKNTSYTSLAALTRTCKLLHTEVTDVPYGKRTFNLKFDDYDRLPTGTVFYNLRFLRPLRRVCMTPTLTSGLVSGFSRKEEALEILSRSPNL